MRIYGGRVQNLNEFTSSRIWQPPLPLGFVKVDVDASLSVKGWIGLGVVGRTEE